MKKKAIIIGGGPAGLTAAHEFLNTTDIQPIVFEREDVLGGIAKTINYKGNRIDIGGHRFFSKSDTVMEFWKSMMPIQGVPARDEKILGQEHFEDYIQGGPDPENSDKVLLVRSRLSRIFYLRKFFDYPISLSIQTLRNLGGVRVVRIGMSYIRARLIPLKNEEMLEPFFINRFGRELYNTFFKDYTEKVWGVSCSKIKAEWGAQRIKGLSVTKAVLHALKSIIPSKNQIAQKNIETSLINKFLYPKYGPGQMWETVAEQVVAQGGIIQRDREVVSIELGKSEIDAVVVKNSKDGNKEKISVNYLFSTMPIKDLITRMSGEVPSNVREIASKLEYRDFMTVGVLLKKIAIKNTTNIRTINDVIPDNWIYIQEPDVKVGRLQIFNNWSPYLVKDPNTVWVGMEYFVTEGDVLWTKKDEDFSCFAVKELIAIGLIKEGDVLDTVVIRVQKAYPSYTGEGYDNFKVIRDFCDSISNLFLIGRNGMHRYNNQDHSMLTALEAVRHVRENIKVKDTIWNINAEQEYHEEKKK